MESSVRGVTGSLCQNRISASNVSFVIYDSGYPYSARGPRIEGSVATF
jgi:hypothetical protein